MGEGIAFLASITALAAFGYAVMTYETPVDGPYLCTINRPEATKTFDCTASYEVEGAAVRSFKIDDHVSIMFDHDGFPTVWVAEPVEGANLVSCGVSENDAAWCAVSGVEFFVSKRR